MTLGDYSTAAAFRDVMTTAIDNEVDQIRPKPQYAVVNSVDHVNAKAQVTPNGQSTQIVVGIAESIPAAAGGVVRIEGVTGDRYISEVISGSGVTEYSLPDGTMGRVGTYAIANHFYTSVNSQLYSSVSWSRDDITKGAAVIDLSDDGSINLFNAPAGANPIAFTPRLTINPIGAITHDGTTVIRDANGGWVRTYGSTGWFNGTFGGGWFMQDTTFLRSFADLAVYTGGQMRAGNAAMESWVGGVGVWAAWAHQANIGVSGSYALLQGSSPGDPNTYLNAMSGGSVYIRNNNSDLARFVLSGGLADVRILAGLPALSGGVGLVIVPGSEQIGTVPSTQRYKENIQDLQGGADNPVWKMRPVKFQYTGEVTPDGEPSAPEAGLIAEELFSVAEDAVALDAQGRPFTLKPFPLLAYLVDAVRYLSDRVSALESSN